MSQVKEVFYRKFLDCGVLVVLFDEQLVGRRFILG